MIKIRLENGTLEVETTDFIVLMNFLGKQNEKLLDFIYAMLKYFVDDYVTEVSNEYENFKITLKKEVTKK